jgi:hypothetical protein
MSVAMEVAKDGTREFALIEPLPHVSGVLSYVVPPTGKPHSYMYDPPAGVPKLSASYEQHAMVIRNLRPLAPSLSLDVEGFRLLVHESDVRHFHDDAEVRSTHYPEVEKLVIAATGARRVVVFDHTVRRRLHEDVSAAERREPVPRVHVDYTIKSGPQRVRDLMADEAEDLLRRRFSIINVWRPIRGPLEDWPLALCDAHSVAPGDLIATDLLYKDRTGETYSVRHNSAHRWFYAPRMSRDEVLLFRCYDSSEDGRPRFVPHAAFQDPTAPRTAAPRESIELRCLVFY